MPVIDYICKDCKKQFFEIVKNCDEKIACPSCMSTNVNRIYKGKFFGKGNSGCSGHCATCSGCSH